MKKKAKKKDKIWDTDNKTMKQLTVPKVVEDLYALAENRIGGSVNIRGIGFQLLYSALILLETFANNEEEVAIRLEGLEDLDLYLKKQSQFYQLKTSTDLLDAGKIWSMKVLQNFYQLYQIDKNVHFHLVHNTTLSRGMLDALATQQYTTEQLSYWRSKFAEGGFTITDEELRVFFDAIDVQHINDDKLFERISVCLLQSYNVNRGSEMSYIRALFYHIFEWAKKRQIVNKQLLLSTIHQVTDDFSRTPTNEAVKYEWITPVSYVIQDSNNAQSGYYDGKAAQPSDIIQGLNARRPKWETEITKSIAQETVTVIKSSSGQGKSTLLYQVGHECILQGQAVYRIDYCPSFNEAKQIVDFLESRFQIGEYPLVLIDGLNAQVSAWNIIAQRVQQQPCRILLSSREEDWKRFGADPSVFSVKEVNIDLTEQEAKYLYERLKQHNKVLAEIDSWQPAWEKVKERGLLIEYIFLLTRGQMIEERLAMQIRDINKEADAAVKLEILRLVSLADVLHVRIETVSISKYMQRHFTITTDLNELYKQLEHEYYLSFHSKYVEGLHPVRSKHLINLLNNHTGLEAALLSLLEILREDYVYDFFMNLLIELPDIDLNQFLPASAKIVSTWPLSAIVYAIDGIMHSEPYRYWKQNKSALDAAFQSGGLQLLLYDLLPFTQFNITGNLAESVSGYARENLTALSNLAKQIPRFEIKNATVSSFVRFLGDALNGRGLIERYEGIAFLFKWFRVIGIPLPELVEIDEMKLLRALEEQHPDESSEIFHYYSLKHPEKYHKFLNNYRDFIIGWIKRKTNTLSIYEDGKDIHLNYLLDKDIDKANDYSVYRINIVHAFLPGYQHYCTQAIMLPFPSPEAVAVVLQNSKKHIPPENLFDNFDVHINQIWVGTIKNQYRATSMYAWEKQYYELFVLLIDVLRTTTKLLEAHLEDDRLHINGLSNKTADVGTKWLGIYKLLKLLPASSNKYFEKGKFEKEEIDLMRFLSSLNTFFNQLSDLFRRDTHLPVYNIREAKHQIIAFRASYVQILQRTSSYFDTDNVMDQIQQSVERLVMTVERYADYVTNPGQPKIIVARKEVESWYQEIKVQRLEKLKTVLATITIQTGFKLTAPNSIIEEGNIATAIIGVEGIDIESFEDDFLSLSVEGVILNDPTLGIHFFHFLFINNHKTHFGIRVSQEYFENIQQALEGVPKKPGLTGNPLPIPPDKKLITYIDGLDLDIVEIEKSDEYFYKAIMNVWKLSEFRQRLSPQNLVEAIWLAELSKEYHQLIEDDLRHFDLTDELNAQTKIAIESFLDGDHIISTDEIIKMLNERALISAGRI